MSHPAIVSRGSKEFDLDSDSRQIIVSRGGICGIVRTRRLSVPYFVEYYICIYICGAFLASFTIDINYRVMRRRRLSSFPREPREENVS